MVTPEDWQEKRIGKQMEHPCMGPCPHGGKKKRQDGRDWEKFGDITRSRARSASQGCNRVPTALPGRLAGRLLGALVMLPSTERCPLLDGCPLCDPADG